jgi:diguanylate cyclase (GGDEF)-like protein
MQKPAIPQTESHRIEVLHSLKLLDSPIQESFERLTRLAQALFQVPIVALNLIDSDRSWCKSTYGLEFYESGRDISFCAHTINQHHFLIIRDARLDERFYDNPLVLNKPHFCFYAGHPVEIEGENIGTFCIIDTVPRDFTEQDLTSLVDIVKLMEVEIVKNKLYFEQLALHQQISELNQKCYVDNLTRLWNRSQIESFLETKIAEAKETHHNFNIAMLDIDEFKQINDVYGHNAGDAILREVAKRLTRGVRKTDKVGRWGGEEFLIIFDSDTTPDVITAAERVRLLVAQEPFQFENNSLNVTITIGISTFNAQSPISLQTFVDNSDKALYKGKGEGKNRVITFWND